MSYALWLILLSLSLLIVTEGKSKTCSDGEQMNADGTCTPCPPGTFMSESNHTYSSCLVCQANEDNASIHYECNSTHNTGCPIGEFETDRYPQVCSKCRDCEYFEAKSCTPKSDTICCPNESMILVEKANNIVSCLHPSTHGLYSCELQLRTTSTSDPLDTTVATTSKKMQDETTPLADNPGNPKSTDHYLSKTPGRANPKSNCGLETCERLIIAIVIIIVLPLVFICLYLFFLLTF